MPQSLESLFLTIYIDINASLYVVFPMVLIELDRGVFPVSQKCLINNFCDITSAHKGLMIYSW
jgi:hypothetical protein